MIWAKIVPVAFLLGCEQQSIGEDVHDLREYLGPQAGFINTYEGNDGSMLEIVGIFEETIGAEVRAEIEEHMSLSPDSEKVVGRAIVIATVDTLERQGTAPTHTILAKLPLGTTWQTRITDPTGAAADIELNCKTIQAEQQSTTPNVLTTNCQGVGDLSVVITERYAPQVGLIERTFQAQEPGVSAFPELRYTLSATRAVQ